MGATKDEQEIEVIGKCLNYICNQVEIENAIRRFNINISLENFYAGVLNIIWECNLVNCNLFEKNKESIDLSDKDRYIAVQVTSTDTSEKIQSTIEKFNKNAYYDEYNKLYMFILTGKARHKKNYDPGHSVEFRIWDASDMMVEIERMHRIPRKRLYNYFIDNIPEAVALFGGAPFASAARCEMVFSRTDMAFWMNPYAADDEQWYEDHYQIALVDYLLTMENKGLYLLIDSVEKDVAYTLNCHAKELGVSQQWTEQGEADTGKIIYFDPQDMACVSRIVGEVRKWNDSEKSYQLIINYSIKNELGIFRMAMRTAREIQRERPPIILEILSLVNPYELDLGQKNSLNMTNETLRQLPESFDIMWSRISFVYKILHENECTFPHLLETWINGTDDEKFNLIEFASHSRTAIRMVMMQMAPDERVRLLSDDQLLYRNVKWDEIIICIMQMNEGVNWADSDFLDELLLKGTDGCRAFLRSKHPITREDWNESICRANRNDYEQYAKNMSYFDMGERLKLLYGCAYAEKERTTVIKNQQLLESYRQMLLRKDMDTEYLFPKFMGGLER